MSVLAEFGDNVRYLESYHHCARPALSNNFDKEFWSRITLQMAHSEPAIRHALIAVGHLYMTEPGDMKHARTKYAAGNETRTLLFHYNKSVKCLVSRMADSHCPPELTLVTCVLYVCIDFLRGNYMSAFTHLTNGLKIISERRRKLRHDSPLSSSSSDSLASPRELVATTEMIEETIVPIFIRGIASALMYGVSAEEVFNMPWPTSTSVKQQSFQSLQDADEACCSIRNSTILVIRNLAKSLYLQETLSEDDLRRQRDLLECHYSWRHNLNLFEKQHVLSKEELIVLSGLKISYHATLIYLSGATELRQSYFDAHLETFKKILHHGKIILDAQSHTTMPAARFTFEISIIPPLYFVATRCRCPTTRREAVSLLERNPPREGLWDAEQQALVSKRVIEMEESKLDPVTGWPVEETRLASCLIDANMDQHGGFWVSFLPARWLGVTPPEVLPTKIIWERFVM